MSAPHVDDELESLSPSDPSDCVGRFPVGDYHDVEAAVTRARSAFPAWRDAGFEKRAAVLKRFRDLVRERQEGLAELIAREVGKALWDARGEAALLAAKVDVTLGEGMDVIAPMTPVKGARAGFHPRGVLSVLGPFNFPAHLPNGHIVPALATGNTVVFKPSDLAPAVGEWMFRAWQEAGLPDGVLELVQGRAETGGVLARHPEVDGVLFTGSYGVGRALREALLDQPGKLLALEMGGKNAMLVLEDADLELATAEAALSMCASTGQRCTSLSRIFVARPIHDEFQERLTRMLQGLRVGDPLEPGVFMGPLVSTAAHERVEAYRARADEAGAIRLLTGEVDAPAPFTGPGLVRFTTLRQSHSYQREEIFGPEAALYAIDDLDQGIGAVNDSDFGLAASLMTRRRESFERCVGRIRTGILNWNRGTIGASGRLPFGGLGRSGNDRPAGILASVYCTVPQAHLEYEGGFDADSLPPGVPKP